LPALITVIVHATLVPGDAPVAGVALFATTRRGLPFNATSTVSLVTDATDVACALAVSDTIVSARSASRRGGDDTARQRRRQVAIRC
jgi:uncharacterized protein (DUF1499 family)